MSENITALWVNTNPSFQRFDKPLSDRLGKQIGIAHWQYYQDRDEASSLDIALDLLKNYLRSYDRPLHLIGHSTGGLLAFLYAQKYPEKVKSLTLLAVGANVTVDWQFQYYSLRAMLPCSREMILTQMVNNIFGYRNYNYTKKMVEILEQDLNTSPSAHSLYKKINISATKVEMPLKICGGANDVIVDRYAINSWKQYFKPGDFLWECPGGYHFFHYFFAEDTAKEILQFWYSLAATKVEQNLTKVIERK